MLCFTSLGIFLELIILNGSDEIFCINTAVNKYGSLKYYYLLAHLAIDYYTPHRTENNCIHSMLY